ncbi:MFS transporter [Rugosimonospora acidiphila]|uniref:MFS transporter n=1 Tax=Rugosimonospora acidiphila TaxID=556531 RepID=A0ABP9RWF7_9ACTN
MSVAAATGPAPTAQRQRTPRYPWQYWVLVVGFGISRVGGVVVPFLTLYLVTHLHLSAAAAGEVVAAFGAGWVVGEPLAGVASDRLGRKPTIVVSLALTAGGYLLLPHATTPPTLMTVAAAIGLVFDAGRTGISAWIADLVPDDRRTHGYGVQYWMLNAGSAVAGVIGGYLATSHITWLCSLDATATLGFAAVVLMLPRHGAPTDADAQQEAAEPVPYRKVLADRRLIAVTVCSLLTMAIWQQLEYGLPLTIHADGLSAATYGAVNAINAVAVLALQPLLQPLLDRKPAALSSSVGALIIGIGMGVNGLAHSTAGFAGVTVIWTVGEILFSVGAATYVAAIAPPAARGRYLGLWGVCFGGAALLSPIIGAGALAAGQGWLWGSLPALGAVCAAGFFLLRPRPVRGAAPGRLEAEGQPVPTPAHQSA